MDDLQDLYQKLGKAKQDGDKKKEDQLRELIFQEAKQSKLLAGLWVVDGKVCRKCLNPEDWKDFIAENMILCSDLKEAEGEYKCIRCNHAFEIQE